MASVSWDDRIEMYELWDHGRVISRHRTAETAMEAGKRYGRKHDQPVSYRGPQMTSAKSIYRPSEDNRSGGNSGNGLFGDLF